MAVAPDGFSGMGSMGDPSRGDVDGGFDLSLDLTLNLARERRDFFGFLAVSPADDKSVHVLDLGIILIYGLFLGLLEGVFSLPILINFLF